jgi:hypothetical protein
MKQRMKDDGKIKHDTRNLNLGLMKQEKKIRTVKTGARGENRSRPRLTVERQEEAEKLEL